MKLPEGIKQITVDSLPEPLFEALMLSAEEQHALDIQEAIENGITYFTGCRVVEPKLWEERYA